MKKTAYFILVVFLIAIATSCKKGNEIVATKAKGTIQKQGITTYQYGTHVLLDNGGQTIYALKSEKVNLDNYINIFVEIKGHKIRGYPVDGGPEYLDVTEVR